MKLKSLLIGSAAVVAAASGARAADAVVMAPAPEPMEYVRVCDVYGAGFFYIPGTETCLKIGGYIFYEIGTASGPNSYHGFAEDQYNKYIRARVDFDARSETEWGTLRGFIRMQADYSNGAPGRGVPGFLGGGATNDPDLGLDEAWLSLGGFRAGYAPSAFTDTPVNGPAGYGTHSWYGLNYGYSERQFVQYNFTGGNGFFATLSLEHDDYADAAIPAVGGFPGVQLTENGTDNYVPDVVGNIGITQGWGTVWGTVGVDESTGSAVLLPSGVIATQDGDTEWAASAGIHLNIPGMVGDSLRVIGYYSSGPNTYWGFGDWSILGSYYHQFTPTFGASVGGQYIANTDYDLTDDDPNEWLAELNLVWTPVKDFEVRSEITYAKPDGDDGDVSGFLRFTRYFGG